MKLQMKREALAKINRHANEMPGILAQHGVGDRGFDTVLTQLCKKAGKITQVPHLVSLTRKRAVQPTP